MNHTPGTSFAAPRIASYIAQVCDKYDITATEALYYIKKTTRISNDDIINLEEIYSVIDKDRKENNYGYHGVLAYRLVSIVDEFETLELVNTSNRDIRVVGYLQNAVASHDDDNRLDFDVIITANQTRYVNGYIANDCVISSVENYTEDVNKDQSYPAPTSNMPDEYVEQYVCTVTAYNSFDGSEFDLEIYLANPYDCNTDSRQWRYLAKTSLVTSYVYRITGEYAAVAKYTAKVQIFGSAYFNAEGLNDEYIP